MSDIEALIYCAIGFFGGWPFGIALQRGIRNDRERLRRERMRDEYKRHVEIQRREQDWHFN
jgi:hypothetical protein